MRGLVAELFGFYRRLGSRTETVPQMSARDQINATVDCLGGMTVDKADLDALASAKGPDAEGAILAGIKAGWVPKNDYTAKALPSFMERAGAVESALEAAVASHYVHEKDGDVKLTFLGVKAFAASRLYGKQHLLAA